METGEETKPPATSPQATPEMEAPSSNDSLPPQELDPGSLEKSSGILAHHVGTLIRQTGNWLADRASTSQELSGEARTMLRDFGLFAQDVADVLSPPEPPMPSFQDEGYSAISEIRTRISATGIDPDKLDGISIGVLDHHSQGPTSHGAKVTAIISDGKEGLIRGASTISIESQEEPADRSKPRPSQAEKPTTDNIGDAISEMATQSVDSMAEKIKGACNDKENPNMRVLNVSLGMSEVKIARQLHAQMLKDPEKFRPWLNKIMGEEAADKWILDSANENGTEQTAQLDEQLYQGLLNTIDKQLSTDPTFKATMENYRDVTREAADNGVTIVISAGNQQNELPGVTLPAGAGYNLFAQSDHVVSVGACDINRTPEATSDDYMANFSSVGTERFHPTTLAHGQRVGLNQGGVNGTSFSAPQVTATVALMLAQNPNLKFDEIKTMLQSNSSRLRGAPVEAQGAGELNIEQAVIAARNSAKNN